LTDNNQKLEMRRKAEETVKNQVDHTKDKSWNLDDVIYELRVHQVELEMQNEELRETQVKLEDSNRKYFDLYNFAPVGYLTLDENGLILDVNLAGATLLKVEKLNLLKKAFIQFIDPDNRNKFHHHITKARQTGNKEITELKLLKKDKSSFYVHMETISILDNNGIFKEFRVGLIDITSQKKAETALHDRNKKINKLLNVEIDDYEKAEIKLEKLINNLRSSNRELEQFAYVSSHDLKEPLRMITSFLQLLQRRYADKLDDDANDFINFAVEGAKRMNNMINDLLDYSRIGSTDIKFEYLESEKILETVLTNLEPLIDDTNAIITYDPLPLIYANEQMMIQLFQNLIGNAIKYHREPPEIHISATKGEDEYIFEIKDNGIGIDPKHLGRIFTIFQRLHSREEYAGTGIGLAISLRILQKHHGIIWAESELGKGTTFYFTIPDYDGFNYQQFF
jgi:two-component system, chemotaxis family, sensor kinase Cph1